MNQPQWTFPEWLREHRDQRPYLTWQPPTPSVDSRPEAYSAFDPTVTHVADTAFNNHERNTGRHVSPFDTGIVQIGVDGLEVRLLQGVNMDALKQTVTAGTRATIGRERPKGTGPRSDRMELEDSDWQEMFKGGLQAALESQTIVFEVWGASRVLTHQLVRSRRAGFHQQSQRSTWYGDRPEVRMPETVWRAGPAVRTAWWSAYEAAWAAYREACDAGVPYEDARYILPEGTVNYIQCEYTIREFIAVFAYRGCSMFLREMVEVMREMRRLVIDTTPELEPFIKISCEKGALCNNCEGTGKVWRSGFMTGLAAPSDSPGDTKDCPSCKGIGGARKCTFQGWENVEKACTFPWARENNRVFLADPKLRIAGQ